MNRHSNPDSVLKGHFCDIVNFFREDEWDFANDLAKRALRIILSTNHLVQTGNEIDTDPFCANMFASSALGSISESIKHYPFVRQPSWRTDPDEAVELSEEAYIAILDAAEDMIEMAEGLCPPPATPDSFPRSWNRYEYLAIEPETPLDFDIKVWNGASKPVEADTNEFLARHRLAMGRLQEFTLGFKNDDRANAELMAALETPLAEAKHAD